MSRISSRFISFRSSLFNCFKTDRKLYVINDTKTKLSWKSQSKIYKRLKKKITSLTPIRKRIGSGGKTSKICSGKILLPRRIRPIKSPVRNLKKRRIEETDVSNEKPEKEEKKNFIEKTTQLSAAGSDDTKNVPKLAEWVWCPTDDIFRRGYLPNNYPFELNTIDGKIKQKRKLGQDLNCFSSNSNQNCEKFTKVSFFADALVTVDISCKAHRSLIGARCWLVLVLVVCAFRNLHVRKFFLGF